MTDIKVTTTRLALLGFLVVLVLAWFCYRPAFGGAFQLDDMPNLAELARVEDFRSASDFVLSGTSGPTGRPLSLLTFALQADRFEEGPAAFVEVNVLIHLINGILLAWCLYQLARAMLIERDTGILIATSAAGLWLLLPLLATSTLLIVQRMATLSALFSLLGLGTYLNVRRNIGQSPRQSLFLMTAVLAVTTLLATFSKESGFLLPMFVLVVEATVFSRPASIGQRNWRIWKLIVLGLPSAAVFAYLASYLSYPDFMVLRKDFSGWERLMTQSQILWLYLQKAVVGLPARLGIYQTEFPVSRSLFEIKTFIASFAWMALLIGAIVWRRRWPLFSFAILWYLAGHTLESTVLPLELYFEHRNYLPLIGPLFAICVFLLLRSGQASRVGLAAITALLIVNAVLLHQFASIWGQPSVAARYWALKYPESSRAVTNLATFQLVEEGPQQSIQTIRQFTAAHPEYSYLGIQELNIGCLYGMDLDQQQILGELEHALPEVTFTNTAGKMLSELFSTSTAIDCAGIIPATVARLAVRLQQNARYVNDPVYSQFHYKLMASIARNQGDQEATIANLEKAISYGHTSELNMMMVTTLASAGDFSGARDFINNAMLMKPANLPQAFVWRRGLEELSDYVREFEKYALQERADRTTEDGDADVE